MKEINSNLYSITYILRFVDFSEIKFNARDIAEGKGDVNDSIALSINVKGYMIQIPLYLTSS